MHRIRLNTLNVLLAIFLFFCVFPVMGQTVTLQESDLSEEGSATGIYESVSDSLFILDRWDELWLINPLTEAYQHYWGISDGYLMDIVQADTNTVWWTIDDTVFGNLNLLTKAVELWDINDGLYTDPPNLGPVWYGDGFIWIAPYYGPSGGLFRFNATSHNLCLYEFSIYASDLIGHNGFLWMIEYISSSNDSLIRLDSTTGQLVEYETGRDFHENANLKIDGNLLWWTEDILGGDIVSFDPDTLIMTVYDLPNDQHPKNLSLDDGQVWYTDTTGSFNRLNPLEVSGVTTILEEDLIDFTIVPDCALLGDPATDEADFGNGTFSWTDVESTVTEPVSGYLSFSLPDGAEPFGIANASSYIWITDPGRDKLIRMPIETEPEQAYIIVDKVVINNDGGSAVADDFNLTLDGSHVLDEVAVPVDPGTYKVGETLLPGYTFLGFSGDCGINGEITISAGENKTCILTNDDQSSGDDYYVYIPLIIK